MTTTPAGMPVAAAVLAHMQHEDLVAVVATCLAASITIGPRN